MNRRFPVAALFVLALGSVARAQSPCPPDTLAAPPIADLACDTTSPPRFFAMAEGLTWWVQGQYIPPLVTTSAAGTPLATAGVLGTPGTRLAFGDTHGEAGIRGGQRLSAGYWLDAGRSLSLVANFFQIHDEVSNFGSDGGDRPTLARPFYDAANQQPAAQLVAYPGVASGKIWVETTSRLLGAEVYLRERLLRGDGFRVDGLAGYRFLHLGESLNVNSDVTDLGPGGGRVQTADRFQTDNYFHGGNVGVAAVLEWGPVTLEFLGKLAVGGTCQSVNVSGFTARGGTPVAGGFLARATNSGGRSDSDVSLVPECAVTVGVEVNANLRVIFGYTFLYWDSVARPGQQVDLGFGAGRPAPLFAPGDVWAQGLNLGIEVRY